MIREEIVQYSAFNRSNYCYFPERQIVLEWDCDNNPSYQVCNDPEEIKTARIVHKRLKSRGKLFLKEINGRSICSACIKQYDRNKLNDVVRHVKERQTLDSVLKEVLVNF